MKPFYVYLLKCNDGSYYCGQTDNIDSRMHQHYAGEIGYTSTRKPVELVWNGEFETREGAIAFEQQIKGWSRGKKEALISGDWERIQVLAKSRNSVRLEPSTVRTELVEALSVNSPSTPSTPSTSSGRTDSGRTDSGRTDSGRTDSGRMDSGRMDSGRMVSLEHILDTVQPALQRRAMAKAITLLESTRADHRLQADELLTALLPHTGHSFRLGISGVPGVGKSTFIEALGLYLIGQGHRVAVLTIDPSSTVSGGSILGDKTRMELLSVHEKAYIRPSPSSGTLGGVAEKTREAMLVCEAAGYDVVIVETVGVGQSETAVANMTDMFVLMQLPNAGDDLQAIKKGVMELADLVVINKADLDPDAATRARAQISASLRLLGLHGNPDHVHHDQKIWHPQVIQLSALHAQGVDTFWAKVLEFKALQTASSRFAARRQKQALAWMWERIDAGLKTAFAQHPRVRTLLPQLTQEVLAGRVAASTAARNMLRAASVGGSEVLSVRAEPVEAHANNSESPLTLRQAQDRPSSGRTNQNH